VSHFFPYLPPSNDNTEPLGQKAQRAQSEFYYIVAAKVSSYASRYPHDYRIADMINSYALAALISSTAARQCYREGDLFRLHLYIQAACRNWASNGFRGVQAAHERAQVSLDETLGPLDSPEAFYEALRVPPSPEFLLLASNDDVLYDTELPIYLIEYLTQQRAAVRMIVLGKAIYRMETKELTPLVSMTIMAVDQAWASAKKSLHALFARG